MTDPNTFEIEIMEDGTVKITSGKISMPIHAKAEDALKKLQEALGGSVVITNLPHSHHGLGTHTHHEHGQQH